MAVSRQKHTTRGVVAQARAFLVAADIVAVAYLGAPVDYSVMREGPYKNWSLRRAAQHVSCPVPTEPPDGRILVAYWFCAKEQDEPIEDVQIVRHKLAYLAAIGDNVFYFSYPKCGLALKGREVCLRIRMLYVR